ncbi:MAG: hypothetical protein ACTSXX_05945 [Candidatus Baldrarchaeia archaeon]
MKTIAVSPETLAQLKELKRRLRVRAYDDVLKVLIDNFRRAEIEEALSVLEMDDEEADKILKLLEERRRSWWRRRE